MPPKVKRTKAKAARRVAGKVGGAAPSTREWNYLTADAPDGYRMKKDESFNEKIEKVKQKTKIRLCPKAEKRPTQVQAIKKLFYSHKTVDYDWNEKRFAHKQLLPNSARKPAVSEDTTDHEYEMELTISGAIFKFYYRMLDIDQTWWVIILALSTVYISLVVIFAVLYFICEHMHFFIYQDGGLFPEACLAGVSEVHEGCNISDQIKLTNCQWPTIDFVRAFLLSLESQTTIGYGGRYSRNHCRYPMVLQTLQFLINVLLMAYMLTITSTRFTRSRSECENLIRYSKNVVICHHEDHKGVKERCLKFRMTNNSCSDEAHAFKLLFQKDKTITYNELVGVSITAKVLVTRSSTLCGNLKSRKHWRSGNEHEQESEIIPLQEFEVKLENWQTVFGTTPIDYFHVINQDSPFYEIDKAMIETTNLDFELIIIANATIQSTGTTYMTKQSYVQNEVKWGQRFRSCIEKAARAEGEYENDQKLGFERDLNASSHEQEFLVDLNKYDMLQELVDFPVTSKKQEDLDVFKKNALDTKNGKNTLRKSSEKSDWFKSQYQIDF